MRLLLFLRLSHWWQNHEGPGGVKGLGDYTLIALLLAVVTSLHNHLCTLAQYSLLCDASLGLGKCIPFLFVVVRL